MNMIVDIQGSVPARKQETAEDGMAGCKANSKLKRKG